MEDSYEIGAGYFCYLKKTLVYVNRIVGTIAHVTCADHPTWHKRVPISSLKKEK